MSTPAAWPPPALSYKSRHRGAILRSSTDLLLHQPVIPGVALVRWQRALVTKTAFQHCGQQDSAKLVTCLWTQSFFRKAAVTSFVHLSFARRRSSPQWKSPNSISGARGERAGGQGRREPSAGHAARRAFSRPLQASQGLFVPPLPAACLHAT